MAFQVQQINPLDLQPSVGVGVGIPFTSDQVFTTTYTTKDAIKANLINYMLTNPGERSFNPTFGAGLREVLFEQSVDASEEVLKYKIQSGVAQYFPQIQINRFDIQSDRNSNTTMVLMAYSVINTNIQDQLVLNIEA